MARTTFRSSSERPSSSAAHATSSGRISKSRSSQCSGHMTRQRSLMLEAASSEGVLQNMVDEAQDVVAGSSRKAKDKGKAKTKSRETPDDLAQELLAYESDTMEEEDDDDEDIDMQEALLASVPENEVCPIIDKDEKPFPIMDLPTEIRLEIYRACLTRPYDILLSKRERPQRKEADVEFEKADSLLSEMSTSPSDADETEDDHQAPAAQAPCRANVTPVRRTTLAHGIRNFATRTSRPIRLFSSRSAPGPSDNQNNTTNNTSNQATQAGASRPATRSARVHTSTTRRRPLSSTRNIYPPVSEPPRNQTQDPLLVNILRASKEIYKEARSVLYNENKFTLDLNTAMHTLSLLHQRSRRQIKHVELEIPTYNEILERFQETVRLSLRYCTGLKTFVIHMPFTLPGADGSGTTGNTTVYANGFDILRWLPQECNIILRGNICSEIEVVVNKHLHLAKTLDKYAYARRQLISNDTGSSNTAAC